MFPAGAAVGIRFHQTVLIELNRCLREPCAVGIRHTPDGCERPLGEYLLPVAVCVRVMHGDTQILPSVDRRDGSVRHDRDALSLQFAHQYLRSPPVGAGEHDVAAHDERDVCSCGIPHRREFKRRGPEPITTALCGKELSASALVESMST